MARDCERAVGWLEAAAAAGSADAHHYLGLMYRNGDGIAEDQEKYECRRGHHDNKE